jgi:hypothetical protein
VHGFAEKPSGGSIHSLLAHFDSARSVVVGGSGCSHLLHSTERWFQRGAYGCVETIVSSPTLVFSGEARPSARECSRAQRGPFEGGLQSVRLRGRVSGLRLRQKERPISARSSAQRDTDTRMPGTCSRPRASKPRMRESSLVAVAFVVFAAACTPGGASGALQAKSSSPPSPEAGVRIGPETRCTGSASKSIDGELRRVRLVITPCRVGPREAPELVLVNSGEATVGYSFPFKLEKKTPNGWRSVNRRQAFPLPLFYLEPAERSDPEPIAVYFKNPTPIRLAAGLYRVKKAIDLTPGKPRPPTMEVSTRFRVIVSS